VLWGGAFKPQTRPYSLQGFGQDRLEILAQALRTTSLPILTEVVSPKQVNQVAAYANVLRIGARNAQKSTLLQAGEESNRATLDFKSVINSRAQDPKLSL